MSCYHARSAGKWAKAATVKYGDKFRAYHCQYCGEYHLTTKGKDERVRALESITGEKMAGAYTEPSGEDGVREAGGGRSG